MTSNTVSAGEGGNTISMGRNGVSNQARTWQTAEEHALRTRPTQTGEIAWNTVIAASGESTIVINNGETFRHVATSDSRKSPGSEDAVDNADAPVAENRPEAQMGGVDKALLAAINRYRLVMDAESENAAGPAATVVYADGHREGFNGIVRREAHYEDPEAA